ncbi:tetratricopeptide repeat protein [bacterium]|nr:tetratricopeptide repeat protein [bacterium]
MAFLAPWRLYPETKTNIVLITIDTLRADHLGCYGYKQNTSPNLDAFAKESLLFENAYSAVPLTLPSHVTMLTGLYPERHGIRDNAHFAWKQSPLIQLALQKHGYNTAAFISGAPLNASFGLNRGFAVYEDQFTGAERTANETTERALQWLAKARSPYFLWVHYFDPHAEYEPPPAFRKKFPDPYDGEIAFADQELAKLLRAVGKNAAVLLTADHGESLGEHGETTHAVFVYNATIHVPLMIRAPTLAPGKRNDAVSLADIAPTILELAGLKPAQMDGVSLLQEKKSRTLIAESLYAQRNYGYAPLYASIRDRKKFIQAPEPEFYDLAADAKEINNLIKKSRVDEWQRAVKTYAKNGETGKGTLPPEEEEKLRSLGYVSGSVAQTGIDPKKKIQIMERFRLGMVMLKEEQYNQAEARFREITGTEKHNGLAFRFLGDTLSAQQKYAEAAKAYATSTERLPDPEVSVQLAKALNRLGETSRAEKVLRETVQRFPHYVEAAFELASFYSGQKQWDKALGTLNQDRPEFHNQRGLVYLTQGDAAKAVDEFLIAIRGSEMATYWNNLGIAYQRMNRIKPAEDAYLRALRLNPSYAECEANLSFMLISLKRWEDAGSHLEHVTSRNTRLWRARMALGYVREMQGKSADAVEIYRKLLEEAPADWPERSQVKARLAKLAK